MNNSIVRDSQEGAVLSIKLQPRASRNQVAGIHGSELKISVTAPPVDSAANQALINYLSELLDRPRSAIELLRGHTSRHKTLLIRGLSSAQLRQKLGL